MTEELEESGPIDYLVMEWPSDHRPDGSSLRELRRLVDRGIVTILDLAFIRKDADGATVEIPGTELGFSPDVDLSLFAEARSGLLDADDLRAAGEAMSEGRTGGVMIYENSWAGPFATSLRRNGAQLVAGGRIPVQAILATLDELEATS